MPFEHARRSVTRVLTMKKPFDVLAEGLLLKNSRDGKTPVGLFASGVAVWPKTLVVAAESLTANLAARAC